MIGANGRPVILHGVRYRVDVAALETYGASEEAAKAFRSELKLVFEQAGFLITEECPMHGGQCIGLEPTLQPAGWAPGLVNLG